MRGRISFAATALVLAVAFSLFAGSRVSIAATGRSMVWQGIDFGRPHALVIGNNDYEHLGKLKTAVGDATAVAALLRTKYGFEVTLLLNATRYEITSAFNKLRIELTEKDNLLVYYAGHGYLDPETDTGYWQPVDAEPNNDANWIPTTDLSRYLNGMSAKHVLVVADSCYSGRLTRANPSSLRAGAERLTWLKRINAKRSRTALTSGGLEPVLDSGGGEHSVFAAAFLNALRENDEVVEGHRLFTRVSQQVVVNAEQTPEYSDIRFTDHQGGDFVFVPVNAAPVAAEGSPGSAGAQPVAAVDPETVFWQSIADSDDPALFEAYLKRYPSGLFAALARRKIETIRGGAPKREASEEPEPEVQIDPVEAEAVAVGNGNIREAPHVLAPRVATLKAGETIYVAGKVRGTDWYLVERDGEPIGFVYEELLADPREAGGGALDLAAATVRGGVPEPESTAVPADRRDPAMPARPMDGLIARAAPVLGPAERGMPRHGPVLRLAAGRQGSPTMRVAAQLCRLLDSVGGPVGCIAETSGGPVENIRTLRANAADMALVRSDHQYYAVTGRSPITRFEPFGEMRSLFALHTVPVAVLTRADSGIRGVLDLRGKRIAGGPSLEDRAPLEILLAATNGRPRSDLRRPRRNGGPKGLARALCRSRLDAVVLADPDPSPAIRVAAETCPVRLIGLDGPKFRRLAEQNRYLVPAVVRGGLYPGLPADTPTVGYVLTVVATARVPEGVVYRFVKAVFENLDRLRRGDLAYARLDPMDMVHAGRSAPLHPGAARYYRDAGLL